MAAQNLRTLISVAAVLGLAACGRISNGIAVTATDTAHQATGRSLCTAGRSADLVLVSRSVSPRQVRITTVSQLRSMAAALCALPPLPAGEHCPAAIAGSVRLVFSAGSRSFPPVIVQESGCRAVTGLEVTRTWAWSPSVVSMLDELAGGVGRLRPGAHPSSVPFGP